MKDKMTLLPWQIDEMPYELHVTDRYKAESIASLYSEPMDEQTRANADAIVSAINNTYGSEINPEAVPDMLKALQRFTLWAEKEAMWDKTGTAYYMAKWALNKAKL